MAPILGERPVRRTHLKYPDFLSQRAGLRSMAGSGAPVPYDEGVATVHRWTRQGRLALLPACLVAIVVGILGMHVLSLHGDMPAHGTEHHAAKAAAADMSMPLGASAPVAGAVHHNATMLGVATTPAKTSTPAVTGSGRSMSDMVMMCAAMLLGAAGSLLLALRLRALLVATGVRIARRREMTADRVSARGGTGPPYAWDFSVIRC